jgi:hypothetical protein
MEVRNFDQKIGPDKECGRFIGPRPYQPTKKGRCLTLRPVLGDLSDLRKGRSTWGEPARLALPGS